MVEGRVDAWALQWQDQQHHWFWLSRRSDARGLCVSRRRRIQSVNISIDVDAPNVGLLCPIFIGYLFVMPQNIKHFISPNFTHKKLEPPLYKDVVDVFEDRMLNWLLVPAKELLKVKHGSVAAVALATNYIEGIEIYASGKDSKGKSKEFFRRGYKRIFAPVSGPDYLQDSIAAALYELLRCGFAHDAMFRNGIYFSTIRKEAFTVTWPKKKGLFDPDGQLESAVINPERFVRCIEIHFEEFVRSLRAQNATTAKENFLSAVQIKWGPDDKERTIGMTEEEFSREI